MPLNDVYTAKTPVLTLYIYYGQIPHTASEISTKIRSFYIIPLLLNVQNEFLIS